MVIRCVTVIGAKSKSDKPRSVSVLMSCIQQTLLSFYPLLRYGLRSLDKVDALSLGDPRFK